MTRRYQLRGPDRLQKTAMSLMTIMAVLTFLAANAQALLWQSSDWLVSTVLPAVVVDLTNDERTEFSAAPLLRNEVLDEAARRKAEHMAQNSYFAHYSPDGVSPWYWFEKVGYVYAHAGENLAIHFTDSSEVVEAWMNSPMHRDNIVSNNYTEIGVGTAKGRFEGYETVFVVQLFGTPAESPININSRDSTSPISAADTGGLTEKPVTQAPAMVSEPVDIISTSITEEAESPVTLTDTITNDVVVLSTPLIATSSGLAVATLIEPVQIQDGATAASIATQPNVVLQYIYAALGLLVVLLLTTSVVLEARRFHILQMAYGVALLLGMGGLLFIHSLLTSGAVII